MSSIEVNASGAGVAGADRACPAARAACAVLDQCAELLGRLDDGAYTASSAAMMGGTIGRHLRHVLDHFRAAAGAAGAEAPVIVYDHRARDVPEERDLAAAARAIAAVRDGLARVHGANSARVVRVRVMLDADGTEAEVQSTLAREIAFATHHAVHHQAMMRVIAGELGVAVPAAFGKAPATVRHEASGGGSAARP